MAPKDKSVLSTLLSPEPVVGVPNAKLLRSIQELLGPLKDVPAHGNRKLHLHPLVTTLVLGFYDPLIRSHRAIEAQSVTPPLNDT